MKANHGSGFVTEEFTVMARDDEYPFEYNIEISDRSRPDPDTLVFTMPSADVKIFTKFTEIGGNQNLVFVCDMDGGTVSTDKIIAEGGETVILTIQPDNGYAYVPGSLKVQEIDDNGNIIDLSDYNAVREITPNSQYSFEMTGHKIYIIARFDIVPEQPKYDVTIVTDEIDHGTVTSDLAEASAGWTVTLTAVPETNSSYALSSLEVVDAQGNEYQTTSIGNNKYTFTMPACDVFARALFAIPRYDITSVIVDNGTGCEMSVESSADAGFPVDIICNLRPDTELSSLTVTGVSGTNYEVVLNHHNDGSLLYIYRFTMPSEPVTVTAEFIKTPYTLSQAEGTSGSFSVTLGENSYELPHGFNADDELTITYTPAEGYILKDLYIAYTAPSGSSVRPRITMTENSDGSYTGTVTMPSSDAVLTAEEERTWTLLQSQIDAAQNGSTITLSRDVTAFSDEGPLTISSGKTVTIDLNGYKIDRGLAGAEAVIYGQVITNNGNLTITDSSAEKSGVITGGNNTGSGGAFRNYGTLTIEEGTVSGNNGQEGGAVYNEQGAVLNISGGVLENNVASSFGGGAVVNRGTVNMSGGIIRKNTAKLNGGGIWTNDTFNMTGGTITDNSCGTEGNGGGVYFSEGRFNISGSPKIYGNSVSNVYLRANYKINVIGPLNGASIGVTAEGVSGSNPYVVITNGLQGNGTYDCFFSDVKSCSVGEKEVNGKKEAVFGMYYVDRTGGGAGTEVILESTYTTVVSVEEDGTHVKWENGWYVVKDDVTVKADINVSGKVNLILCDGAKLNATYGIRVDDGNSLTIYGQREDSGELTANGYRFAAGIGSGPTENNGRSHAGTITIHGGIIKAKGYSGSDVSDDNHSNGGAGIGGGDHGYGGIITIYGGNITANGGYGASGIGGGEGGGYTSITIKGGIVNAKSSSYGAGIGGGKRVGTCGDIIISGGEVTATGGRKGSGIGNGFDSGDNAESRGRVFISGGTVTAIGAIQGATRYIGIGGGAGSDFESVTISGGNVTAIGGIGVDDEYNTSCSIELGWTNLSDSITSDGYYANTVKITDGKYFVTDGVYYSGTLSSNQIEKIEGKTLVPAENEMTEPELKTKSLVLSGQIGVNFFMDLSCLSDAEKAAGYMEFNVNGKTQRADFDRTKVDQTTGRYYGFTCYVTSVEMADTINAVYHYTKGEVDSTYGFNYSLKEYFESADSIMSSFDDMTQKLIKSVADYGHYAQPFLADYNNWTIGTEHERMNKYYTSGYSQSDINAMRADLDQNYRMVRTMVGNDFDSEMAVRYSLVLDSETTIKVYFKLADAYQGSVSFTLDGNPVEAEKSGGRYIVKINNISSHLLGTEHTVIATTENGNATVDLSALSYVKWMFDNYQYGSDAYNMCAALYKYAKAASRFVAAHQGQ